MVPRGEVGIVIANLGLTAGLLGAGTFGAVLVAVVLTTVVAPYLLTWAVPRALEERRTAQSGDARGQQAIEPGEGPT